MSTTFTPQGNILDEYNLTTYNLTFYMLPNRSIRSENRSVDWDPSNGIVIAQSGVTSQVFIEDFTFRSHPSYSKASKNSTFTQLSMTLREFTGASLIDKIIAASLELGVENYFQIPYFIQLTFKANRQEPNGSEPQGSIPNLTYRWPVLIGSVETAIDAGGSTYSVTAYHYDEAVQRDEFGMVSKSWQITDRTVGGALDQLATQMSLRSVQQSVTGLTKPDQYRFVVDPTIAAYRLTDADLANLNRNAGFTEDEVGSSEVKTIKTEQNISIIDTVNRIVTSSPDYQRVAQQTDTENNDAKRDKRDGELKQLHRVITKTRQLEYDTGRGVYQREFTYIVVPHLMGQIVANNADTNISSSDRFQQYLNNDLLAKRYYFIFTGQNDQVLEFDLTFNFSWYVNMPVQGGFGTDYAHVAEGKKFAEDLQRLRDNKRQVAELLDKLASARSRELTPTEFAREAESVAAQIQQIELTPEEQETITRLLNNAREERIPFAERQSRTRFVEEITIEDLEKGTQFRKYPLAFLETSVEKNREGNKTNRGQDTTRSSGPAYVNSLFNQAFTGPSGDLANIEVMIKGDPYWLGASVEPDEVQPTDPSGQPFPNIPEPIASFIGQPAFVFTLRTPELPGVNTGTVRARETAINGVYLVNTIDHEFSNGKFTQRLTATVDPTLNIEEVFNRIEE